MFPPVPARLWPEPGAWFLVKTHHAARVWHPPYNEGQVRARINEQIEGLQWRPPRPGQPFDPASTVTELLRRLPTHQVTAAAADGRLELPDGPETTVYGLYGLEALFRGVPLRLYILDAGYDAFLLAIDTRIPGQPMTSEPERESEPIQARTETAAEADGVSRPERVWQEVGDTYLARLYEAGHRYHGDYDQDEVRERIAGQIAGLAWREPEGMMPFSPAMFLMEVVPQLPLRGITAVAINGYLYCPDGPETATYGLYGVEGYLDGVRSRLYLLDIGIGGVPVAVDLNVPGAALPGPDADQQPG